MKMARIGWLVLCVSPGLAVAEPAVPPAPGQSHLTLTPYVLEVGKGRKVDAEIGRLRVPENRSRPGSRRIELAFLRIKSTAVHPGPPIVYLAGGPGESGIDTAQGPGLPTFLALREIADVVALDQRGAGQSTPRLDCSGTWDFPLDQPGDPKALSRRAAERVRTCLLEARRQGIDLGGYNTQESADDVEALRQALGVPRISLWGISYGTHLALAVIRRHEPRLHRVILTGVDGPDDGLLKLPSTLQTQLSVVDRLCRQDPRVRPRVPDFLGLVKRTLTRLEKAPVTVPLADPVTGDAVKVVIGKWDFQFITARAIMPTWQLMKLPSVFGPLGKGDFTPLAREVVAFRRGKIPPLMGFLMVSASGASPERRSRVRREARQTVLGDAVNFPFPDLCEALGLPMLGPEFRRPVRSTVPALFISGTLDGNTPVRNAEEVGTRFPNRQHLIIEGASHGYDLFFFAPGLQTAMGEFLRGRPLSTTRIKQATLPFRLEEAREE